MEFDSAHDAYRNVRHRGFRTFCKVNGQFQELFTGKCDMHIGMSEVEIRTTEGDGTGRRNNDGRNEMVGSVDFYRCWWKKPCLDYRTK